MSQKSHKELVETFEEEFKNKENLNIVDDLMSSDFVHHIKIPNIEPGPAGMKQVGSFVFSQISDIRVTIDLLLEGSDFAVSKISATGIRLCAGNMEHKLSSKSSWLCRSVNSVIDH